MSYIGNTPTQQAFTPAIDYFSGNGSTTAFTLSRPVASVAQIQAVIENVPQNPSSAYTVSGNTITFTSAPPSGTNNIYVEYTSPITQVVTPGQGTVQPSSLSTGGPYWDTSGNVGIGTASPTGFGSPNLHINGTNPLVHFTTATSGVASGDGSQIGQDGLNFDIYNFEAGRIGFGTSGAERMRIDSSGNVGIGTSVNNVYDSVAGARPLVVQSSSTTTTINASTNAITVCNSDTTTGNSSQINFAAVTGANPSQFSSATISAVHGARVDGQYPAGQLVFSTSSGTNLAPTEKMRLDSSGNLLFNSGYGSAATAYGCRAWVNFRGTSTVTIRGSGNVSSVTDNTTGDWTVNLTTAMPDANYAFAFGGEGNTAASNSGYPTAWPAASGGYLPTSSALRIRGINGANAAVDLEAVTVSIFR